MSETFYPRVIKSTREGALPSGLDLTVSGELTTTTLTVTGSASIPSATQDLGDLGDVDLTGVSTGDVLTKSATDWVAQAPITTLNGLTDVNTSGASDGEVLTYGSGTWTPTPITVASLSDVTFPGTLNDYTSLMYVAGLGGWYALQLGMTTLSDVNVTSAVADDLLQYNGTNWGRYARPKWTNFTPSISYGTGTSLGDSALTAKYLRIDNTVDVRMLISVNLTTSINLLGTREFTMTLPVTKTSNFSGTHDASIVVSAGESNPNDSTYPQFHQLSGRTVNGTKTIAISMAYTSNTGRNVRFGIQYLYTTD